MLSPLSPQPHFQKNNDSTPLLPSSKLLWQIRTEVAFGPDGQTVLLQGPDANHLEVLDVDWDNTKTNQPKYEPLKVKPTIVHTVPGLGDFKILITNLPRQFKNALLRGFRDISEIPSVMVTLLNRYSDLSPQERPQILLSKKPYLFNKALTFRSPTIEVSVDDNARLDFVTPDAIKQGFIPETGLYRVAQERECQVSKPPEAENQLPEPPEQKYRFDWLYASEVVQ